MLRTSITSSFSSVESLSSCYSMFEASICFQFFLKSTPLLLALMNSSCHELSFGECITLTAPLQVSMPRPRRRVQPDFPLCGWPVVGVWLCRVSQSLGDEYRMAIVKAMSSIWVFFLIFLPWLCHSTTKKWCNNILHTRRNVACANTS